jgi:hypothetical protein
MPLSTYTSTDAEVDEEDAVAATVTAIELVNIVIRWLGLDSIDHYFFNNIIALR